MDKFPEDFNRLNCVAQITKNQEVLIKDVRDKIHKSVLKTVNNSNQEFLYSFPDNLWKVHRKTLTEEILTRFGEISTITGSVGQTVTLSIENSTDIPSEILGIKIKFF